MKLSTNLLKNKQNFYTPQKRIVSFTNEQNSFEVRQPMSSKYVVSKRSIHGTPSTWYLESNRKQSQVKTIINLLSDSKVSIQQHIQQNAQTFSPVKEETSQNQSIIKYHSKNNSKQEFFERTNPKIHELNVRKKLAFNSSQKNKPFEIYNKIENRTQNSTSKTKRGISLVKNFIDKKVKNNAQPQEKSLNQCYIQFLPNKQVINIQFSYCRHFFIKIYDQFVQKGEINKYNFSRILLQQKLIEDLVKDRHFVKKIWQQILQVTGNKFIQTLPMKIIFAFLISVLGYSIEQIQLFETQQALMKINSLNINHQAIEVFKNFRHRNKELKMLVLSRPIRPNSFCNKKY